jgi:hypothetical protein
MAGSRDGTSPQVDEETANELTNHRGTQLTVTDHSTVSPGEPAVTSNLIDSAKGVHKTISPDDAVSEGSSNQNQCLGKFSYIWNSITWTPESCRYNPHNPPKFSMSLNLIFAMVCIFV